MRTLSWFLGKRSTAVALLFVMAQPVSFAQSVELSSVDAHVVIQEATKRVINLVKAHRDDYRTAPEILRKALDAELGRVVDFESIAYGVMSPWDLIANEALRDEFAAKFRASIVRLYTDVLVQIETRSIEVLAVQSSIRNGRAVVRMNVATADGQVFQLHYAMRDTAERGWLVENILLNQLNVGLTFRNQFALAMAESNNQLELVVERWEMFATQQPAGSET